MLLQPRSRREFPAWADATDEEWSDWKWQFQNRIWTPEQLENAFPLTSRERDAARRSRDLFRLGITPHWATLIDPADEHCPMRLQAIPGSMNFRPRRLNAKTRSRKKLTLRCRGWFTAILDAGIPTGNQTVLLRGVNDCPVVMRRLMHELVKVRCRPYYLYSCDHSQGLGHFRVPVETGLEILESLCGHTSGFAIPVFVVDAPGGGGTIPLLPDYLVSDGVLRNYEGRHFPYRDASRSAHSANSPCRLCGTVHTGARNRMDARTASRHGPGLTV